MANPQHAILTNLEKYQWYTHLSRSEGADLGVIKKALKDVRAAGAQTGVTTVVNVCILFGPTLLADLTDDVPADFQPYPGYESPDGKVAKGTQEELLLWVHSADKDLCWETQFNFRNDVAGHMTVARETPTFIYRNSLDLTGFIDGTGNPEPEDQHDRGIVPDGQPGAGGSFCIAQRWVHDLAYFNGLPLEGQENTFGRTKSDSTKLAAQVPTSHLKHVELREGETADESTPKRGEMVRRSTPYAFHDGTVGLYFMGFCREQAPMRERMEAMYGMNGQARDAITDYSTPASGSFYFAPSVETLDAILGSAAMTAERLEVQRTIAADPGAIFRVLSDPEGHVAIDSSGMLQSSTGEPVTAVGDTFVVHMDREALNDFPMGRYDVTVIITTLEPDREIAWTIEGQIKPPLRHVYGYTLEPVADGTLVTAYYDWSGIDPQWREANIFPIIPESALRATLGILDRTVTRGGVGPSA